MKANLLIIFSATLVLTSCVSRMPVAKLTSVSDDYSWEQGRQVVKTGDDNFTMYTVFERNEGEDIVFDVEIFNHSGAEILLDPESFYFISADYLGNYINGETRNYAINPEVKILELEKMMKQDVADESNQRTAAIAAGATLVALSVASAALSSNDGYDEVAVEPAVNVMFSNHESGSSYTRPNREDQYQFWANQALRKTTLSDGESARGTVYFKMKQETSKYLFSFPVGAYELKVEYNQMTY